MAANPGKGAENSAPVLARRTLVALAGLFLTKGTRSAQ
jgi:hypothetical protein